MDNTEETNTFKVRKWYIFWPGIIGIIMLCIFVFPIYAFFVGLKAFCISLNDNVCDVRDTICASVKERWKIVCKRD